MSNDWPEDSILEYHAAKAQIDHDLDNSWNVKTSDDIFAEKFPIKPLLLPGLDIGLGRPCGIWGHPSAGKNYVSQELGLSVATGRPAFAGRFHPTTRGRVIHITYDMGYVATALRYRGLANGMGATREELHGQLTICAHPPITLCSDKMFDAFYARLEGYKLCILDNLRAATPGLDENDSNFGAVLAEFGRTAREVGCAVLYLHHTKKDSPSPDINAGRGSGAITGASGTIWHIQGTKREDRKITCLRSHDLSVGLPHAWGCNFTEFPGTIFDCSGHPSYQWKTWNLEKDDDE